MAAKSKSLQWIAGFGKQLVVGLRPRAPPRAAVLSFSRRSGHSSAYDKNVEEQVQQPSVLPDEVIRLDSDKYWAPHPQTGVFGPTTDQGSAAMAAAVAEQRGQDSVLEEKAWFRPTSLEDLDKTHHA
ncbi:PREDICTED: uncharacterized protein LOC104827220 [Tarenaya hassleriana]|uniref:uncharacterized protein LOC104827220 n=1 Tax=Tarenaya hassleriana TaxID=28532 RepID=UPI00053C09B7|nr:PREDICTED: uncharacterized protein LOC104827220 [Tarenaya hassleriana]